MRRTSAGFAWVSMMDVLFALFGGLVVLTVIISTKLGASTSIEDRPFHALTIQVVSDESTLAEALGRMNISFVLFGGDGDSCGVGANHSLDSCLGSEPGPAHTDRIAEFATAAEHVPGTHETRLTATLLLTGPPGGDTPASLRIMPTLRNVSEILNRPEIDRNQKLAVRLSAKSQRAVWDVPHFAVSVDDLLNRAKNNPLLGAALLPLEVEGKIQLPDDRQCIVTCGEIKLIGGGKIDFSWQ